ncbi:DUF4190 domain-containing protein [Leucobacter denitrificans]|uniref:DUF4190 domain-containing protein n=1 Tax=Leucobacter denitrificans TaxID=683042 RepID=UPI003614AE2C
MTQQPPHGYQPPQQPQYQQVPPTYQPAPQMPAPKPPTNVFAIISLIGAFFLSIVGIIFGHIALSQIKRTGESGRGLALAGTIIGYVRLAGEVLGIVFAILFFGIFGSLASQNISGTLEQLEQFEEPYYGEDSELQDMPWSGTEKEAFCTALDNYDLSYDDEYAYYEELLAVTDDPEFAALVEAQLDSFELDFENMTEEEYTEFLDQTEAWAQAHGEQLDECYYME